MKKCGKCFLSLQNSWKYCPNCGEKIIKYEKDEKSGVRTSVEFCKECDFCIATGEDGLCESCRNKKRINEKSLDIKLEDYLPLNLGISKNNKEFRTLLCKKCNKNLATGKDGLCDGCRNKNDYK